jgi:hypothetical protein
VINLVKKVEDKVQKWLSDVGIFRKKVPDDNTNFHFIINYPEENVMDVIQPKGNPDLVVIGCATNVSPEHAAEIRKLSDVKKEEFIWNLRYLLNSNDVDFQLSHPNNVLESFLITAEIYEDGLTKDRLIYMIKKIFRAKIHCVWKIQEEFGIGDEGSGSVSDSMYV